MPGGSILWLFSDTIEGKLTAEGALQPGWKMHHNSWGRQDSAEKPLELHAEQLFPGKDEHSWYWVYDGLPLGNDRVQVFLGSFETTAFLPKGLNFRQNGSALATIHWPSMKVESIVPVPHFREGPPPIHWGAALLRQTDGIYVYGTRDSGQQKDLVVARTPALSDFPAWRFWDGQRWTSDPSSAQSILSEVANELSVLPAEYEFCVIAQVGTEVRAHNALHPWGPFRPGRVIHKVQESEPGVITYNAKVHPELGMMLTYNRNVLPPERLERQPWLYRPQCFRPVNIP